MQTYTGSCHCGAVRFEFESDLKEALTCNCSHCHRKGFVLNFVPHEKFRLVSGEESLTDYYFNKQAIKHRFCKICGAQGFAEGVAFPQMAINLRCVESVDIDSLTITKYNGKDI
jgi:hypothetical protein